MAEQKQEHATPTRTPFFLVETNHDKCVVQPQPVTAILGCDSVTKLEYGLKWTKAPSTCMMLKKYNDRSVSADFLQLATWLSQERGIRVFVQPEVHEREFAQFAPFSLDTPSAYDFAVVLGGDGIPWLGAA